MLLITGGVRDQNLWRLADYCKRAGIPHETLYVGKDAHPAITWSPDAPGQLLLNGVPCTPAGVFIRYDVFEFLAENSKAAEQRANAWYTAVASWLHYRPEVRALNLSIGGAGQSKPAMLRLAQEAGLTIPKTIISNDVEAITAFLGENAAIAKPINGGAYCHALEELLQAAPTKGNALPSPAIVQEKLSYPEYRVFIIGDDLVSFRTESSLLDYRQEPDADVRHIETMPAHINDGMRRLAKLLDANYGAADFKTHPKTGEIIFLEYNSGPMFGHFDYLAGGRICRAIASHLLSRNFELPPY
jgi:hypothetical protein